tara:strand:- start:68 stop:1003 length:936 start_codon:yes stop_codon:yes gene_type:complete
MEKATVKRLIVQWQRKKKHEKMASTLITGITNGSESRISDPEFYPRVYEFHHHYNARDRGRDNYDYLRVSPEQVEWRKHNSYFSFFRRFSRLRFNLHLTHGWRSLLTRSGNKSSKSGVISRSNRQRNRCLLYYGLLISLLSVTPVKAEEGDRNVSNPVAAATGNVTNQAVMFQNNGAPSRQHYGPNISCNGSTMTFSPFYMGNHTTPFDEEMVQQTYTVAENWGAQINFMVPLDRRGLQRCLSIAARQEEKMRLDYELVRALKCAELQTKGFMLRPKSRVASMCSDVIAISAYIKSKNPPEDKTKPWYKPF